jgi:thymidylate synthase (FAD)
MKILYRPRVALKWHTPDPEREIESAGRVCWQSWGRSDGSIQAARDFIARLKKVGHIDVMEEAEMSVWIECSRSASHQIVRHRTQHHLQASQRYIKMDEPEFLVPPSIANNDKALDIFLAGRTWNWNEYRSLREAGIRAEDARFALPNACLTKMKAKANLANWRKFIDLRSDQAAQWEVRMISNSILMIAHEIAPSVFNDQYERFLLEPKNNIFADRFDRSYFDNMNSLEAEDIVAG